MAIMKVYQYIYYRAYDLFGMTGTYDLAWGTIHFLSFMECAIIVPLYFRLGLPYDSANIWYKAMMTLSYVVPLIINYFLFHRNKKYEKIINDFKNESAKSKKIGRISLVLAIALVVVMSFL